MSHHRLPTMSHVGIATECPASFVLPLDPPQPSTEEASKGIAAHAYLAKVPKMGAEQALQFIAARWPQWAKFCASIDLDGLPLHGNAVQELAIGIDLAADVAREIGRDIDRKYGQIGLLEIVGTLDVAELTPDVVIYSDYKTGRSTLPRPRLHQQMRTGAAALAKLWGRTRAVVRLIHIEDDGTHWTEEDVLEEEELKFIFADLLRMVDRIMQEGMKAAPSVHPGEHCTYCPAFLSCPSKRDLLALVTKSPSSLEQQIMGALTEEKFAEAHAIIRAVGQWYARMKAAEKMFGQKHTAAIGDGWFYGTRIKDVASYDGNVVFDVVEKELGFEAAKHAVTMEASKASIQRAVEHAKSVGHPSAQVVAAELRRLMVLIDSAGGITRTPKPRTEEFKVKDEAA